MIASFLVGNCNINNIIGDFMKFKQIINFLLTYTPEKHYDFNLSEDSTINNKVDENPDNSNFQKETPVFPSLNVNLEYMKTKYNSLINSDIIIREFILNAKGKQYNAFIVYIDGMVNSQILDDFILEPLMMRNRNNMHDGSQSKVVSEAITNNITVKKVKKFNLSDYLMTCLMPQNSLKQVTTFEKAISGINSRKLCFIC